MVEASALWIQPFPQPDVNLAAKILPSLSVSTIWKFTTSQLLKAILAEEEATDEALTQLVESAINQQAGRGVGEPSG